MCVYFLMCVSACAPTSACVYLCSFEFFPAQCILGRFHALRMVFKLSCMYIVSSVDFSARFVCVCERESVCVCTYVSVFTCVALYALAWRWVPAPAPSPSIAATTTSPSWSDCDDGSDADDVDGRMCQEDCILFALPA